MTVRELIENKNITLYRLSKNSGIPYTTVNDIYHGRTGLDKCTAETVYKLSKELGVSMEELLIPCLSESTDFELYKSSVCHRLKELGDIDFIAETLQHDNISKLYHRKMYPESLYLLAMLDYVSRVNNIPLCTKYKELRNVKLEETLYPAGILAMAVISGQSKIKEDALSQSIPEFLRHNIIESEVRNVI